MFSPDTFFQPTFDAPAFRSVLFLMGGLIGVVLAATAVVVVLRGVNHVRERRQRRLAQRWRPLLLDVLAGEEAPAALQARVEPRQAMDFVAFLYRYSRCVRGECRERLCELAAPFLPSVDAWSVSTSEQRARRIQLLGALGFDTYADEVVAALDDPAPLVGLVAARAIARDGRPQHVMAVVEHLDRFKDWSTEALAGLLVRFYPAILPLARSLLADASAPSWKRAAAATTLRKLYDDEAGADHAARLIKHEDPDRILLIAAVRLLGHAGRARHVPIVEAISRVNDAALRHHAVRALAQMRAGNRERPLWHALGDASPMVALQAAQGLKAVGKADRLRNLAASSHPRAALAQQVLAERDEIQLGRSL